MANFVNITLDTTGPTLVSIAVGSVERTNTAAHDVSFNVSNGADVAQYKLWSTGSDFSSEASSEGAATWENFTTVGTANDVSVTINTGSDGTKTLIARVRDDVGNESGTASDSLVYDSTGPTLTAITINGGDEKTGSTSVTVSFTVSPSDTYLTDFLVWGNLSNGETSKALAEAGTGYVSFTVQGTPNNTAQDLSAGDGVKTLTAIVRDDLGNESVERSDSIELDQTSPVVAIFSAPNPSKISRIAGFDTSVFTWYWEAVGTDVGETGTYQIEFGGTGQGTGTVIPTTAGSANITGSVEAAGTGNSSSAAADTAKHVTTTIKGDDLWTVSPSDGVKRLNIYVTDNVNNTTPYQP